MKKIFCFLLCLLALSGCSALSNLMGSSGAEEESIDVRRPPTPGARVEKFIIPKSALLSALDHNRSLNQVRIVQVYSSAAGGPGPTPEYRLFDVRSGSVYDLLGLENTDVLIQAEGYAFASPKVFLGYVDLLRNESKAQIEVRRRGEPIIFAYTFL